MLVSVVSLSVLMVSMSFFLLHLHADQVPKGFISIDCGSAEDTTVTRSRLVYKSDKDMIASGMSNKIAWDPQNSFDPQYWTLRSFPNGTRNCYHVEVEVEVEAGDDHPQYLIKAYFVYGNYDGLNFPPTFDLYLGPNFWRRQQINSTFVEIVTLLDPHNSTTHYIDVCLVNVNKGVPFISSLELRPFNLHSPYGIGYPTLTQNLQNFRRYNIGGTYVLYPEDVYDRQWDSQGCDKFGYDGSSLVEWNSTDEEGMKILENPYNLPQSMLETACRATNSSVPLELQQWSSYYGSFQYYFCFHFYEVEKLKPGQFREMRIVFNDLHTITDSLKLLQNNKPLSLCSNPYQVSPYKLMKLSISATSSSSSSLPPILNGLEIFYITDAPNPLTFSQDVKAMRDIKEHYKEGRNWEGDPCQPVQFSWEGLNCSNNDTAHAWPRIISLNLSSSKLRGDIAYSISNLTAINSLDLSINELEGEVPEFLAYLPQLQLLNLSGNKLTGLVPEALLQKYKNGSLVLSVEGNQKLCWSPPCNHKKKKNLRISVPILCSVIVAPVLFAILILGLIVIYKMRSKQNNSIESKKQVDRGSLKLKNRLYSHLEVVSITNNFGVVIGEGGFGKVYLGGLEDQTPVAVKVLSLLSNQGYKEFQAEAQLLMVLNHRKLVTLLGYCDEANLKALIYEYMPNGNLKQHLSGTNTKALNWMERLQIAVDVAHGLEYLHNGCKPPIIHRDLKPANILLDKTMRAKIADFGLSRTFATENQSCLLTRLAGTPGYLDPRTQTCGNVNKQSDIYSFGIILLELISGQAAISRSCEGDFHILSWVESMVRTGDIQNIVDSRLGGQFEQSAAWKIVELAMSCAQPSAVQRPDMCHVLVELKECLGIQRTTSTPIMSTTFLSQSDLAPSPR